LPFTTDTASLYAAIYCCACIFTFSFATNNNNIDSSLYAYSLSLCWWLLASAVSSVDSFRVFCRKKIRMLP